MWRRSWSGSRLVTSSSPMRMRPLVGSMSRLIIFMVVVLPHPEGPTSMTISPAGISMVMLSTAACDCAAYFLVTPSSRILAPPVVFDSDTNPPRDGETGEQVQDCVQDDRQDKDAHRRGDDGVGRVRPAHAGDAGEDVAAEARSERVRRNGGDAHQHLRRDAHACHDDRPGQRQLEPDESGEAAHPHPACRLDQRLVDAVEADDDVAQNRKDAEEHQQDHRRYDTESDDADQYAE